MKKLYYKLGLALLWLVLITTSIRGQETDTTYAARMNYIFQHLDKAKVPFGLLKDVALEMAELNYYKGTVLQDSNRVFVDNWNDIYLTLATARIHPNTAFIFPHPQKVDSIWFAKRKPGQITLAGLYYQYSRFSDDGANKVTILNDQIYDKYVNGVWQNPYTVESVMAFAPATIEYNALNLQFLLPAELWLSNQIAQVSAIQLDAGDGLGFRILQPGISLPVQYYTNGSKELKFKIILNDNSVLQSHSIIHIQSPVSLSYAPNAEDQGNLFNKLGFSEDSILGLGSESDFVPPPADLILGWSLVSQSYNQEIYSVSSTETFDGVLAKGYVTIQYANADKKIYKPLIVAEGFDPGIFTNPEDFRGVNTFDGFYNDIFNSKSTDLTNLFIDFPQYDVIYIDWQNGTADLRLNTLLLKTVIRKVNEIKVANGLNPIEKNVVLGRSMGGVIARYALKKMEDAGENHDTRLYISHDAPHQGANVPLGFQYLAKNLRKLYFKGFLGDIINFFDNQALNKISMANTPAAKQMLINYADDNYQLDNSQHIQWQNELQNLNYPQLSRNVAISNGSECGNPYELSPGANLFLLDGILKINDGFMFPNKIWFYPLIAILTGKSSLLWGLLPGNKDRFMYHFEANSTAIGGANLGYWGKIAFKKKILGFINLSVSINDKKVYLPNGMLTYENLPGGKNFITEDTYKAVQVAQSLGATLNIAPGFSFVPTTSALDIGQGLVPLTLIDYYASYTGATPPPAPKNSPFDNFITAFSSGVGNNEEHISFTQRNGKWLADELNLSQPQANCNYYCSFSPSSIVGPATICGTTNYSLSDVPAGASITWTAWGPIQINGANNQSTVSVKMNTNGTGTLTAKINLAGSSCGDKSVSRTITASGAPAYQEIQGQYYNFAVKSNEPESIINTPNFYPINAIVFSVPNIPGVSYQWTVNGSTWGSTQSYEVVVYAPECGYGYPLYQIFSAKVKMTNACGSTTVCKEFKFNCLPTKHIEELGSCYVAPPPGPIEEVIVFPNPAGSELKVSLNANTEEQGSAALNPAPFELTLYNEKGKKMLTKKSKNQEIEVILDTQNLPNGIYYLHIQQGNELIKKQVIIQHE